MDAQRLAEQLRFIAEIEALKTVYRRNLVCDRSRQESTAEHSFQLALMVTLLAECSPTPLDVAKATEMALVHDLVEVDAGDTFAHDPAAQIGKEERERAAADRLIALLPDDQGARVRSLWDEFEAGGTPEARFVRVLDRLQAFLLHRLTGGEAWKRQGVTEEQVRRRMAEVRENAPALWPTVEAEIRDAVARGQLSR